MPPSRSTTREFCSLRCVKPKMDIKLRSITQPSNPKPYTFPFPNWDMTRRWILEDMSLKSSIFQIDKITKKRATDGRPFLFAKCVCFFGPSGRPVRFASNQFSYFVGSRWSLQNSDSQSEVYPRADRLYVNYGLPFLPFCGKVFERGAGENFFQKVFPCFSFNLQRVLPRCCGIFDKSFQSSRHRGLRGSCGSGCYRNKGCVLLPRSCQRSLLL